MSDKPSHAELTEFALGFLTLEDGTPIGDVRPEELADEIEVRQGHLNAMRTFLGLCPERAETVKEGQRLARERADLVDASDTAWGNLTEVVADDMGLDACTLTDQQRDAVRDRSEDLAHRWEDGDQTITSSVLQERLQAFVDMERRVEEHIGKYGNYVWWQERPN